MLKFRFDAYNWGDSVEMLCIYIMTEQFIFGNKILSILNDYVLLLITVESRKCSH